MRFLMLNWRDPKNPLAGGAERVTQAYLHALVERGHEAYWFTYDFPGAPAEETLDGIRILRGGGKGTAILMAGQWYRRQPRFDLVIDQHHGIPWYAPWWCRTNCLAYIHEVLGPIWHSFYPGLIAALGQAQERWTHGWYRDVPFWTPSESTRRALLAHGVREVKVIPNGCDTRPLPGLPPKPLSAPLKLITVSRLAPNKRVDHALRATHLLGQRGVAVELTVVGRGDAEGELRQLARELNLGRQIRFTGALAEEEKNAELQRAHLLIHTSVREGWGLNVIEANAMGTPAIVYPVHGLVDSTVDGVTGRIVASETPEALAEELQALLRVPEKYDSYRNRAWERAKEFAWARVLPQAADWLESMATRKV